jgi:hypothetical protein
MTVPIAAEDAFSAGSPEVLLEGSYRSADFGQPRFDISPDGERFLMIKPVAATDGAGALETVTEIQVVLNWFEELRARVPTER